MNSPPNENKNDMHAYRTRLLVAMMLVVVALTALGIFLAQRKVTIEARLDLEKDFHNELVALHGVQEMRHDALEEVCRTLVQRPRIHAALEDNALDLLYPSAKDELRDIINSRDDQEPDTPAHALHALFYRFLDSAGAVISPPKEANVGALSPEEERLLALPSLNNEQQNGYVFNSDNSVHEILAMPIVSTESGEVIAALVLGFKPVEFGRNRSEGETKSGIWLNGQLHLTALAPDERNALNANLARAFAQNGAGENSLEAKINGRSHLIFYKQLNPGSLYPPAYEVAVYPLTHALARQRKILWQVLASGAAVLLLGLLASQFLSRRLSAPVEELAVTSEHEHAGRVRAEHALEMTSDELQRSARFSADASHQLKTPVTVLRAGIEELLAREGFTPKVYDELSALLHQTYRITGVIDDLLLLSRMDAGHLQIQFDAVNLSELLEEWIDDASALRDDLHVQVETNFQPGLFVAGEKSYIALIVQNLLENAHKYNIPGGHIGVAAEKQGEFVVLTIENKTARPIPTAAQEHIFERFHRSGIGENVPGHGLGLNLARELARLHGGDLRLVRSDKECTAFEVRFRAAPQPAPVSNPPDRDPRPASATQVA